MANYEHPVRPPPRRRDAPQPPNVNADSSASESNNSKKSAGAPPKSRRTGVWGDTVFNTSNSNDMTAPPTKLSPDTDEDIPIIPDLDELQEEENASQVAQAPNVAVTRVATYKELDSDLFQHAAFASVDDINLRLLTTKLLPEVDVKEPDTVWTWDAVFAEVMSQLPEQSSPTHISKEDLKPAA